MQIVMECPTEVVTAEDWLACLKREDDVMVTTNQVPPTPSPTPSPTPTPTPKKPREPSDG